jgi:UDP:flavonoid glycosyltransferase YjiC (YdhE family)
MPERGPVCHAVALGRELVMAGIKVHAFATRQFAALFRAAGIEFHDLYEDRPINQADSTSVPVPCRYVTFAAVFGDSLSKSIEKLRPDLLVYDSFAVAALVVSRNLSIPAVSIVAGHNMPPAPTVAELEIDPRVALSPACLEAVEVLRGEYGIADASPFSYASTLSPLLNVIPEPEQFYLREEAIAFAPCVFFGSIDREDHESVSKLPKLRPESCVGHIYACFGTVASRYYASTITAAIKTLGDVAAACPELSFTISLGGADLNDISMPASVRIRPFVDQWEILRRSEAYITHHGVNSTHEAVYLETPMISYPFFYDQPKLALRCQQLGLAVPLVKEPRARVEPAEVIAALRDVQNNREAMRRRLEEARGWELEALERRGGIIQKMLDLA